MEQYKTSPTKLRDFFRRSRDGWKRKCQQAKQIAKYWSNRCRALQASRDKWKQQARELQREVQQLRRQQQDQKTAA